jgi:DNA polymerase III subunit gamma/tau
MSYLVIARKYRPLIFEDVIGQEHVTTTITNAIKNNKVHHAYLLTGPRGVGKTTISRILAKSLNCETGVTPRPCCKCRNCLEIDQGNSLDVKEIDGASNRGIDEIRDLRDDIKFSPASSRKKIYIIDEVHMLTNQAFNALLKTLEEPPEHAVFIFATTEANEVPATILSRCQRHDFKRVEIPVLTKALKTICEKEGVSIDDESLIMIAKSGDGSVRDSQSALDQVIAYAGNSVTAQLTYEALGLPGLDLYFDFLDIAISKNTGSLLTFIDGIFGRGLHIISFVKGLMEFYRDLLIIKTVKDARILDMTGENVIRLEKYTGKFSEKDLLMFLDILSQSVSKLKSSPYQRMEFELILLKILHHEPVTEIETILQKLSLIEGDQEISIDEIVKDVSSRLNIQAVQASAEISAQQAEIKKKTPETVIEPSPPGTEVEFGLNDITARWKDFIAYVSESNSKLNFLEYGVPFNLKDNRKLEVKFDPKDKIFMNLCDSKKDEIEKEFTAFYKVEDFKITLIRSEVKDSERIIEIIPKKKKTDDEKKNDLLKEAPQLKFLFEDPFNCKFVD